MLVIILCLYFYGSVALLFNFFQLPCLQPCCPLSNINKITSGQLSSRCLSLYTVKSHRTLTSSFLLTLSGVIVLVQPWLVPQFPFSGALVNHNQLVSKGTCSCNSFPLPSWIPPQVSSFYILQGFQILMIDVFFRMIGRWDNCWRWYHCTAVRNAYWDRGEATSGGSSKNKFVSTSWQLALDF